eukprot:COSAG02_NODE_2250_length_9367_cov_14.048009_1_plen_141_part_10
MWLSQRVLLGAFALQILWWIGPLDCELSKARKGEDELRSWCWANEGLHFRSLWNGCIWRGDVITANTSSVLYLAYLCTFRIFAAALLVIRLPPPPPPPPLGGGGGGVRGGGGGSQRGGGGWSARVSWCWWSWAGQGVRAAW